MEISAYQAQTVLDGAEARAHEIGVAMNIAVLDAGAHLKAFRRMDGAVLGSIDVALRKARTAVLFQANSEVLWEYARPGGQAPALELSNGGLAPFGGGVPLRSPEGDVIGAIGVSGGAVSQDADVAEAALAALTALSR